MDCTELRGGKIAMHGHKSPINNDHPRIILLYYQRVQPSSLTRRQVTQGVIPHATSHMMNIGHFKWKKVNFIELFIFEFKHCSSIQHIQQENMIENQHKMSNM